MSIVCETNRLTSALSRWELYFCRNILFIKGLIKSFDVSDRLKVFKSLTELPFLQLVKVHYLYWSAKDASDTPAYRRKYGVSISDRLLVRRRDLSHLHFYTFEMSMVVLFAQEPEPKYSFQRVEALSKTPHSLASTCDVSQNRQY